MIYHSAQNYGKYGQLPYNPVAKVADICDNKTPQASSQCSLGGVFDFSAQ